MVENDEKLDKLCSGFSLLDERDKEYILGILQALLFANAKMNLSIADIESFGQRMEVLK